MTVATIFPILFDFYRLSLSISQKFSDSAVIMAIAVSKRCSQDFEYWIFVYLPFGNSRTTFSKTTFSLHLLTLGYHFRLTSSLPQHF